MFGYIGIGMWTLFFIYGISHNYSHYSLLDWIVLLFTYFVPCLGVYIYKTRKKKNAAVITQRTNEQRQYLLDMVANYSVNTISNPSILLKKDELAYFEQLATLLITQNKAIGSTGRSSGTSVRIAKGVYVRSGGSGSRKIYKDVTSRYMGQLSITNQRITFMQAQKAFEIPLDKLTNIAATQNNLILQQANKSYTLELQNADIIEQLIRKILENK